MKFYAGYTCSDTKVPMYVANEDFKPDLLIVVTVKNEPEDNYIAWATTCYRS